MELTSALTWTLSETRTFWWLKISWQRASLICAVINSPSHASAKWCRPCALSGLTTKATLSSIRKWRRRWQKHAREISVYALVMGIITRYSPSELQVQPTKLANLELYTNRGMSQSRRRNRIQCPNNKPRFLLRHNKKIYCPRNRRQYQNQTKILKIQKNRSSTTNLSNSKSLKKVISKKI